MSKDNTKKSKPVESTEIQTLTTANALSPIEMIKQLKESGLEVADMKEMLALQKEYEANEALKLFNVALAQFKAEDILIAKDTTVEYETSVGITTYNHATLGNIVAIAVPLLSKHGFSHRWSMDQLEGGLIRVTFILTHQAGHSERTSLQASPDQSGGKNNIQAIASTVSYLERYTMLGGTGLATADQDDDGIGSEPIECISKDQQTVINDLIKEVQADNTAFLAYCKTDAIEHLPVAKYDQAVRSLEAKRDVPQ